MTGHRASEIAAQLQDGIDYARKIKKADRFIAYFQSFTNTYASLDLLKERYDVIYEFPEIVGISIGTRPDCIDEEKLELISRYAKTHMVWLEYGLQSIHDRTLLKINRADTAENFYKAIALTSRYPEILVCVHVILGLPGESREEMLQTADALAPLPIHGAKIHNIHLVKNTALAQDYQAGNYVPISFEDYIQACCDFLERIPENMVIHRLLGDAPARLLVDPKDWCNNKFAILNAIKNELRRRGTVQGSRVKKLT